MRAKESTLTSIRAGFWCAVSVLVFLTRTATAVPPHPDLAEKIAAGKSTAAAYVADLAERHARGICTGHNPYESENLQKNGESSNALAPTLVGPFKALAILVEFSDHPSSVNATFFDSLIYDSVGSTVRTFYDEISFSQIDIVTANLPSVLGWRTAPQTYSYYVNGAYGTGPYPNNSQKLVEDLVDQVDPLVDFTQYDNDSNGYVDVLIIVHTGSGAEYTGNSNDIWSHKWGISPRQKDGVYISSFTVQPELWSSPGDMTIGVYAHELGHGFGLPDLYDVDGSSNGVGRWCLMSYGSWNGSLGSSPAHPCAWSRIEMGFATSQNVASNTYSQTIGDVENGGTIFRLWTSGGASSEYFLIENRRRTGYDVGLPSEGLLIWHIDDAKSGNTQEWYPGQPGGSHYLVALEQADGQFDLEHKWDNGDGNDPFPGAVGNTSFDAVSSPNSNAYTLGTSFVQITNISAPGANMTADLIVGLASGIDDDPGGELPVTIALAQNYPNPFNPTTEISFDISDNSDVKLSIYNILGEKVRAVLDERISAGAHSVEWNGTDDDGAEVASGIYFYRLEAGEVSRVKKMVLIR
jgi:immune inhibitor A